jgi:HPt (histidine-containing phosphotransfer) domain-containing protein
MPNELAGRPGESMPDAGAEIREHLRMIEAQAGAGLAAQMLEAFLRDAVKRLTVLSDALGRQDRDALYRVAHTMQGSAAAIGARSLAQQCTRLAIAARTDAFDRCEALARDLEDSLHAIQQWSAR